LGYNTSISKQSFIFISLVLLTSITFVPTIQSQSPIQTQTQSSTTDNSQIVKEIAEKVATANPDTNATFVEQILTELTRQSAQVSTQGNVLEEIYSQVSTYPYGIVSQSLARFARALSTDNSILLPTVQKIIQEITMGKSIPQSIVNIAVQDASGGGRNVNDEIALAAQIIAKQFPGLPVRNIESIIIQMALEISRAQGKSITGQTIFEIASQIKQNPNGVLTQAIIQLAKQDTHDNGKTGQTATVVQKVVKVSSNNGGSSKGNAQGAKESGGFDKSCPSGYESARDGSGMCLPKYDDCPAGSANPKEGCTLEGFQYGPDGYGYYSHGACETCQKTSGLKTNLPSTGIVSTPQTPGQIVGKVGEQFSKLILPHIVDAAFERVFGSGSPQAFGKLLHVTFAANPSIPRTDVMTALSDIFLRTANKGGASLALQAVTNLQAESRSSPNVLHQVGQFAQLYQSGDGISAAETSDLLAERLATGLGPVEAIAETPVPEAGILFAADQMPAVTEPSSTGEIEVKSLPPSNAILAAVFESPVDPVLVPEPTGPEGEPFDTGIVEPASPVDPAFIPGLGPSTQSPLSEKISSLPPLDTTTVDDQPTPEAESTIPSDTGDGSIDVVEPELQSEQPLIQEPNGPEGSPFIPGLYGPEGSPSSEEPPVVDQPEAITMPSQTPSTLEASPILFWI
jgi:hypothetical protein